MRIRPAASSDLSALQTLQPKDLESISLAQTQVTDDELVHLQSLSGLERLDLSSTPVEGAIRYPPYRLLGRSPDDYQYLERLMFGESVELGAQL